METKLVGSAHLVAGHADGIAGVLQLLARQGVNIQGNPDVYARQYARFGADDARELRERANLRGQNATSRYFIVATPTITTDAQNVLLKTLEEPPGGAVFFLITPAPQSLLPTLRSRMQVLALGGEPEAGPVDAATFLAAAPEKRIEMLSPLLEKDEDDKRDLRPVLSFLAALETRLKKNPEGLRALYSARKYLTDKGALVKPLLEQVALLMPRV